MNQAVTLARDWVERQHIRGLRSEIIESEGRTPLLWIEVDGSDEATAHSYFAYIRNADTAPTLGLAGRYLDKVRRTPDGWKMAHRSVSLID